MEKSRAIELLEHLAWDRDIDRNPYGDALNMAIDALKAQLSKQGTTKDAISRQDAIDAIEKNACNTQRIMDAVNNLPPVQPEPHWIPVSEKLPELDEDGYSQKVLVSFDLSTVIEIMEYRVTDGVGKWYIGDSEDCPEDIGLHAVAWMPLPERYVRPADAETAQGGLESAT